MALTPQQINNVYKTLMRDYVKESAANVTKPQVKAAIGAINQYFDDNATTINQTLPVAFRTSATASQKAALFAYVALERFG